METKKIGLISATIICINAMIGVGIFTTPAKLAFTVGPAGILTYLFSIVAVTFIALSLALVSKTYPEEGSFYNYTRQWAGDFMGFVAAISYIIGIIIALGLLTNIASQYFHQFMPFISKENFGLLIIFTISGLNALGIKIMQTGQIMLLFCTLGALAIIIGLCFANAKTQNLVPFMPYGISSVIESMSAAVFSFLGFESAASLYRVVKDPEKNVSRAIILSMITVGILYIAFIFSIILAIPQSTFTSIDMPLSQAILNSLGNSSIVVFLTKLISIAILTAICGVLQSIMYSSSSLTMSLFKNLFNNLIAKNSNQSSIKFKLLDFISNSQYGFSVIIMITSLITLFNFFILKDINLFFNLTSMFVIFAFLMSILAMHFKFKKQNYKVNIKEKIIVYCGLISSFLIFVNAVFQVFKSI